VYARRFRGVIVSAFWPVRTAAPLADARRTFTNPDRGTQALIAYLAYRAKHSEGASYQEVHEAAVAAVQTVLSLP
jgi:hypothetical protein